MKLEKKEQEHAICYLDRLDNWKVCGDTFRVRCQKKKKRIKRVTIQDATSQKIFDLEKLVFYSY